jgi:hypothetical protein
MSSKRLELFQGEAKTVTLTIVDQDGSAVDVATATMTFKAAARVGETPVISLTDAAFSAKGSGTAQMALSATDTDVAAGEYQCEIKTTFSASNIDINQEVILVIKEAM